MWHRKRLSEKDALHELRILKLADQIDPDNLWHIGKAEVETKTGDAEGGVEWTLKFKNGGRPLTNIYLEKPDLIKSVMRNLGTLIHGIAEFNKGGLYHRDIKLDNIVYNPEGKVKVIDFGISLDRLPDSAMDDTDLYENTYPIWPFETQVVSTNKADIFSDDVYLAYTKNKYYVDITRFHRIDTTELCANIINLRRKHGNDLELHQVITRCIDVYSCGVAVTHLLTMKEIRDTLSPVTYKKIKLLCRRMVEPYTTMRISIADAALKYRAAWDQ